MIVLHWETYRRWLDFLSASEAIPASRCKIGDVPGVHVEGYDFYWSPKMNPGFAFIGDERPKWFASKKSEDSSLEPQPYDTFPTRDVAEKIGGSFCGFIKGPPKPQTIDR